MKPLFWMHLGIVVLVQGGWEGKLKFNQNNTFTILQLTDLHIGSHEWEDIRTIDVQLKLIKQVQPDLVVISGDMYTGNNPFCYGEMEIEDCFQDGYRLWTFPMTTLNQPYAIILGNHDAQGNLNRSQIMELDRQHPLSLSQLSPDGVTPGSTYNLPIYDSKGQEIDALLWMFDSMDECDGAPHGWGCVDTDQIDWMDREYRRILTQEKKQKVEGISFIHIPPKEYVELVNNQSIQGNFREERGIVAALMRNNVLANFCGHDHDNDFSGIYSRNGYTIELTYGRKTGYGYYGPPPDMLHGGRVITLTRLTNGSIQQSSYILEENGNRITPGNPIKSSTHSKECKCVQEVALNQLRKWSAVTFLDFIQF